MKQQLRKPENWQDFEFLCKMLWGEIWNCPEIKKNGRAGQKQDGVDVYGIPHGETEYYGVQCKGKDDYTKSELTKEEIDKEIENAKNFQPKLKKFYFATTANKDVKIEEYIRLKDIESRKTGGFEIHLFSWEDIVDLIDENRRTHDWYISNIKFRQNHDVTITFENGETHLEFTPILLKTYIKYGEQDYDRVCLPTSNDLQPKNYWNHKPEFNHSSCVFSILIINNGNVPIENFKMYILFPETNIMVGAVDKVNDFSDYINHINYNYNTFEDKNSNKTIFEPQEQILVQTDRIITDQMCLIPTIEEPQDLIIGYEFKAKDFNKKGQLNSSCVVFRSFFQT